MLINPFIHLFKTPYNFYIYDVNTDSCIPVSKELYLFLKTHQGQEETMKKEIEYLKSFGYLKDKHPLVIENPEIDNLDYYLKRHLKKLVLQVTQNCNFRCSYCPYTLGDDIYQRTHTSKYMNWEIAKKAVDFFALRCIDTPNVGISFYGGEPLLEYDLIKKVILYCETRLKGKELSYNMTTNGTLLTEDMANFFVSKKVHLLISLDGPPDIHNRQRRFASDGTGTFDKIIKNVKQLSNSVPGFDNLLSFNTVIDPNNDIQAVNHFFQDSFFKSKSISPNDLVPPLGTQLIFPKSYQNTVRKQELLAF